MICRSCRLSYLAQSYFLGAGLQYMALPYGWVSGFLASRVRAGSGRIACSLGHKRSVHPSALSSSSVVFFGFVQFFASCTLQLFSISISQACLYLILTLYHFSCVSCSYSLIAPYLHHLSNFRLSSTSLYFPALHISILPFPLSCLPSVSPPSSPPFFLPPLLLFSLHS